MALSPIFPLIEGESLTSYLSRCAKVHANMDLDRFLQLIEIPQQEILLPSERTLNFIAELVGITPAKLRKTTFLKSGTRMRMIGSELVHSEFISTLSRKFCRACLSEDIRPESPSDGAPVGRVEWQFAPVRVCVKHGRLLEQKRIKSYPERFSSLPELMSAYEIEHGSANEVLMQPSALQHYIHSRLIGVPGPSWLDGQPIDLAARACEMLGIILVCGAHANLTDVTEEQWIEASNVGFRHASQGRDGIYEGLNIVFQRHLASGKSGGPQFVFGRLYQWLQFSKNSKQTGPISDIVRQFILEYFPIEEGTNLFGKKVVKQQKHSLSSLARKSNMPRPTLRYALAKFGMISDEFSRAQSQQVFDAAKGESLVRVLKSSISVKQLENYLNCHRTQAEQLVRSGLIPPIFPRERVRSGLLANVSQREADSFLKKLLGKAMHVEIVSTKMTDIVTASKATHRPVVNIVTAIMNGELTKVETSRPNLKFKGIMVCPDEVGSVIPHRNSLGSDEKSNVCVLP